MAQWQIAGQNLNPGEKIQIDLEPNVPGYKMPATLINGAQAGKTIAITAGIHSGEYPGVAAAIALAKSLRPEDISGRLLIIHCVNTSGFWAKSPGRVPECGTNLNGDYPGAPEGSVGARIADFFVKEIFPKIDFLVDLHSGGRMEPLTPCLFFPVGAGVEVMKESLAAAKATNIPNLIASTAKTGHYSYAAGMGVPGLLLERGYGELCKPEWAADYVQDLRLLLKHFELLPGGEEAVCSKKIYNRTIYLTAQDEGLWYSAVAAGDEVKAGDLLGRVEDFYGNPIAEYRAEGDGVVFYHAGGLLVKVGDSLAAYGLKAYCDEA